MMDGGAGLPKDRVCDPEQINSPTKLPFKEVRCLVCDCHLAPPADVFDECHCVVDGEPYALLRLLDYAFVRVNLLVLILISVWSFWLEERLVLF